MTLAVALLGAAHLGAALFPGMPLPGWVFLPGGFVALCGAAALVLVQRREGIGDRWFEYVAGTVLAVLLCAGQFVFPAMNALKTPAAEVPAMRAAAPADRPILIYRMDLEIVPLYAGRLGRRVRDPGELRAAMEELGRGVVVFNRLDWEAVGADLESSFAVHPFQVGGKRLVWIAFDERFAS
jgi:hypothetical protein